MKRFFTLCALAAITALCSLQSNAALYFSQISDSNLAYSLYQYFNSQSAVSYSATYGYYISDATCYNTSSIEIDLNGRSVSSFYGMQAFTNLQHLICKNMGNSDIDMTYLQNLPILTLSECNDFIYFTFPSCPKLQFLTLNKCGYLVDLDVSACTGLTDLRIVDSPYLDSFNPSQCPSLEMLCFSNCQRLSNLDLSENSEMRVLDFYDTNIENIDLSHCSKLLALMAGKLLTTLNTDSNPRLKFLDCSGCSRLSELNLSNNTNLTTLLFDKCHLASIDLTNNSKLGFFSSSQESSPSTQIIKAKNSTIDGCKSLQQWKMTTGYALDNNKHSISANYYLDPDSGEYVYFIGVDELNAALGHNLSLARVDKWFNGASISQAPNGRKILILAKKSTAPTPSSPQSGSVEYSYRSNFMNVYASQSLASDRRYFPHFYIDWTATVNDVTTDIDGVVSESGISISTAKGCIFIEGNNGAQVNIFSINGAHIYCGFDSSINVDPGLYIVKIGNDSRKVIVR